MSSTTFDPRWLRTCLGQFATGVTVVTYTVDGEPRGATVNSFTSVSMDPPLVLVSLARRARAAQWLADRPFAVNVLAADQLELALQFAGRPQPRCTVAWCDQDTVPRLRGTIAWLQCRPYATHDGGDHLLVLGEVVRHDARRGDALLFHRGEFRMVGPALYDLPVAQLDGRRIAPWVGHAHQLHAAGDHGLAG